MRGHLNVKFPTDLHVSHFYDIIKAGIPVYVSHKLGGMTYEQYVHEHDSFL